MTQLFRFPTLAFCLLCLAMHVVSQSKKADHIQALLDRQTSAWNKGDLDAFMQTYWHSDSLLFIGKNGVTYGWKATLKRYKKSYPDTIAMGKLSLKLVQINPLAADTYFVVGQWELTRLIGNQQGHFTLLVKKINGEWKIIADHSS